MQIPELSYAVGGAELTFNPDSGALTGARVGGTAYLDAAGAVAATQDGRVVNWSNRTVTRDADEVEIALDSPGLQVTVRHSFAAGWMTRLVVHNRQPGPSVVQPRMSWVPAGDSPAWALAAGAVAAYAVLPARQPVLGGVLTQGSVSGVSGAGFEFGNLQLAPGARWVAVWDWGLHGSAEAFGRHLARRSSSAQVPSSLWFGSGEGALIRAGADDAVLLPAGVSAEPVGEHIELHAAAPGTYPVEVRSATGTAAYTVTWAPPASEILLRAAERALTGRSNSAGVVVLPEVATAMVLQFVLRLGLADRERAEDALDLFTERWATAESADPAWATFLCGEFDRTGDPALVEEATACLLRGVGSESVARQFAIRDASLARLVAGLPPVDLAVSRLGGRDLDEWGSLVGEGLPGAPVRAVPTEMLAQAAAVLSAVPDQVSPELQWSWACSAHELGRRTEAMVLAQIADAEIGPAHAWLVAALRTR